MIFEQTTRNKVFTNWIRKKKIYSKDFIILAIFKLKKAYKTFCEHSLIFILIQKVHSLIYDQKTYIQSKLYKATSRLFL